MIQFQCAKCGKRLMVKDESAGKRAKCPGCGEVMVVPGAKAAPAAAAPRPSAAAPPKPVPRPAAPAQPPRPPAQAPKAAPTVSLGTGPAGGLIRAPSHLSKKFYLVSMIAGPASFAVVGILYIVGLFVFGGGAIVAQQGGAENPQEAAAHLAAMGQGMVGWGLVCLILFVVAYAAEIYSGVIGFVLLYKMWSALQAGPVRATPGKAVGLLFIPFYNFYWMFQAILGWTRDYNAFVAQRGIESPPAPEGLAKTLCILALVGAVPCLAPLALPVVVVLMLVFYARAIDCVNALALVPQKATAPLDAFGA
jgi:DNA-directed RNA polymerase subunit RPC12/RpoP